MERNTLISISNLSVAYENVLAIDSCTLNVFSDDFIGVIGPNGGGKTSLVKALLGLVEYSGNITYSNGLVINDIGYLPQISNIDKSFPISVQEVINSGLQTSSLRGKINCNKVQVIVDQIGIKHLLNRHIGELSGGELQRTLLCRALISEPKLLILDEPANFVDNSFECELYELLKRINEKMAIVMVSHDLGTITSVVKSIVCVNKTVHRHDTNELTPELLENYHCPIQIIAHGNIPHTVLYTHE